MTKLRQFFDANPALKIGAVAQSAGIPRWQLYEMLKGSPAPDREAAANLMATLKAITGRDLTVEFFFDPESLEILRPREAEPVTP